MRIRQFHFFFLCLSLQRQEKTRKGENLYFDSTMNSIPQTEDIMIQIKNRRKNQTTGKIGNY